MVPVDTRPGPARSDADKEARRTAILGAAKTVFAAKGFHASTMADVARAAGISYGSVYWYFESKEVLFHALMDEQEHTLRRHIGTALGAHLGAAALTGEAAFRAAVRATFELFEIDRDAVTLLFRDSLALDRSFETHLRGIYEGFIDDIEAMIAAAQAAGYLVEASPRLIAFSVAAVISQLALRRLATDDGLDAAAMADVVVSMLLDGLRPRHGTAAEPGAPGPGEAWTGETGRRRRGTDRRGTDRRDTDGRDREMTT